MPPRPRRTPTAEPMVADIHSPELDWEGDIPCSRQFADVYYSRHDGLGESRQVFLAGNGLPERWQGRTTFTIGELGFGTGLNFLAAWQAWRETQPATARLHFISVEQYPLERPALARAHRAWPRLAALAAMLREHWPLPEPGCHIRYLDRDRIRLLLLFGDARELLPRLHARADAWFLDGFSPARNPQLWQEALLQEIARRTVAGGSVATYAAAGWVRRNLQAVGFQMTRRPGFAGKREMLSGRLAAPPAAIDPAPWFRPPAPVDTTPQATVVGAGLAGTAVARALARRGWDITLLERHGRIAGEASGNPVGVLMPAPEVDPSLAQRYFATGFRHTLDLLRELGCLWQSCGVLYGALESAEIARQQRLLERWEAPHELLRAIDASDTGDLCGHPLPYGGLWFPHGGWVAPDALCQALLGAAGERVRLRTYREALRLERQDDQWQVLDGERRLLARTPVVIITAGRETGRFQQTQGLPLRTVRGQLTSLAASAGSEPLRAVLCGPGYLTPPRAGHHWLGATYDEHRLDPAPRISDRQHNLRILHRLHPALASALQHAASGDRVAFRSTSADRRPLLGGVPDLQAYRDAYGEIWRGQAFHRYPAAVYHRGLYLSAAHGSRGLVSAPLAGEWLAALITGEPLPLEADLCQALHPGRFAIRAYRRANRPTRRRREDYP